jgi:hypothetical protein
VSPDDAERRLTVLETRVDLQMASMQRELGKLESAVGRIETAVDGMRLSLATLRPARLWQLAALVPVYALVIDLLVTRR